MRIRTITLCTLLLLTICTCKSEGHLSGHHADEFVNEEIPRDEDALVLFLFENLLRTNETLFSVGKMESPLGIFPNLYFYKSPVNSDITTPLSKKESKSYSIIFGKFFGQNAENKNVALNIGTKNADYFHLSKGTNLYSSAHTENKSSKDKNGTQTQNPGNLNNKVIKERTVNIATRPTDCRLYIDGVEVGYTPYEGVLSVGNHSLYATTGDKRVNKEITIYQTGGKTSFTLTFDGQRKTDIGSIEKTKIEMIFIKGGTFEMGNNIKRAEGNESPTHQVSLSSFYMGKTEVTQSLWKSVMGNNPCIVTGDNLPVVNVSWNDTQDFLAELNRLTGQHYRLPTEAEWEYAAGGGKRNESNYAGTNLEAELKDYAWNSDNSNGSTHPVATKKPNALGLYDMSGNVWEWCSDWMGEYPSTPQTNPTGPATGRQKINRGGSWRFDAFYCRINLRGIYGPSSFNNRIGFRLAMSGK